ncbi:MAG TPA: hypothetical protein ENN44_01335 [Methanoculleus sp.]|nr:hypothetical protein [Methanoculleus sp.]
MTPAVTTIKVTRELKERLDRLKVHPREPYNEVIGRLIDERKGSGRPAAEMPRSSSAFHPAVCYRLPE